MENENKYIIEGGEEGKKRLNILSEILNDYTKAILAPTNESIKGKNFLDVGSGGGNVSVMVSKMVGNDGSVTAIDFDAEIVRLSIQDAEKAGISNIRYRALNAYELDYDSQFDIAYSRFLLTHLQQPKEVLNKMVKSVKPGGRIIIEDIDFSGHFCQPACPEFDSYVHLFSTAARNNGQNPDIGLTLFEMFKASGIENIQFDVIQPCYSEGNGKWIAYYTMDKIKDSVIKQGLATPEEIDDILLGLKNFTENPDSIISLPRIFRVWGTRASQ